jgi:hypothetical protein
MAHDATLRPGASQTALIFGVLGAPSAWAIQEWSKYALTSHMCYPGSVPAAAPGWLWPLLLVIDIAALIVALAAIFVSYRIWHKARDERQGDAGALAEIGEGRTRFFALWGMVGGGAFAMAILFDLIAVLVLPLCR